MMQILIKQLRHSLIKLQAPSFKCLCFQTADNQLKMEKESKKLKVTAGRWTRAEHDKFMDALEKYGRDWVKVQKKVKTRTLLQIRSHAQKVFLNMTQDDIKAFIGSDDDSSSHFDEILHDAKQKGNGEMKMNCSRPKKSKQENKLTKKDEQSSLYQGNKEIVTKFESDQSEGNTKIDSPKIIVSQVSNKSGCQNGLMGQQSYESIFLQMFKENQGYFLGGGDFLGLTYKQIDGFQPICFPVYPHYSLF